MPDDVPPPNDHTPRDDDATPLVPYEPDEDFEGPDGGDAWCPFAERVPAKTFGGSFTGGPRRGVLHTTESRNYTPSRDSYYGHQSWPHFTLARRGGDAVVFQHIGVDRAARALRNASGGVETNRRGAVQIEIAWTSEDIANLPAVMVAQLRRLMTWIEQATGIKAKAVPNGAIPGSARVNAPQRMSAEQWNRYDGWCGHRHVPENDHWDAGAIDWAPLLARDTGGGQPGTTTTTRRYAMLLLAAAPPDRDALRWASDHVRTCPHPITTDVATARAAAEAGEVVVTVGGPPGEAVGTRIAGADRRETLNLVCDLAQRGWPAPGS